VCFTPQFANWWLPWLLSTLFDHPQSWLGLQLLVNSSVPTKLQKQLNTVTPSFFVCKRFAARKKIVSPPNFTVSCTYEYTMGFVVLCVWKCSLMSTTQLVRLFLFTTMWVRFFLSKSFQFLTSEAICNCKLSEMSIPCENLFLGFCFFIYSNQKQFNYCLCKASHQEQLKGSWDVPGHMRKLSQWTTTSHVLHMMKVVDPCMLAAKSRAVVAWAAFHKHLVLHKQHMCLVVAAPLWPKEVGPQSSICRPPDTPLKRQLHTTTNWLYFHNECIIFRLHTNHIFILWVIHESALVSAIQHLTRGSQLLCSSTISTITCTTLYSSYFFLILPAWNDV
jgi:hypothetical protein